MLRPTPPPPPLFFLTSPLEKITVIVYLGSQDKVLPGVWGEQENMIIYFKGTRDIFGISLRVQGISRLQLKGTLTSSFWEQWDILIGNKGGKVNFWGVKWAYNPPSPPPPPPWRPSKISKSKLFTENYRRQCCIVLTCHQFLKTNFQKKSR